MERKDRIDLFGGTVLVVFSALLGLNQVMVKLVNAGLQPVFQAGLRSVCAFLPVLLYALFMRKRLSISDGSFWPGVLCGVFFAGEFMLLFSALEFTTVSRASVFFYTMPFWVALVGHFIIPGERLTPLRLGGLVLAIVGVALALSGRSGTLPETVIIGDIMCLLAACGWAGIALVARTTSLSRSSPEMQLLYQLAVSAVILVPASLFFGDWIRDMTPVLAGIFAFQVLVVVGVGFLTWFWILSIYPASDMASFSFLAPLFGVLLGWLILDETITGAVALALVLICCGIVMVNYKPRVRPPVSADA
ncbi:DMT family transporter [Coralliovum pocilloporae]|uniref:DMT family transporter n=1 Tax=Coralliovum pocilloporae TaxID=3066369 RepID=UPI0033076BF2